jgi:hypothetical protein
MLAASGNGSSSILTSGGGALRAIEYQSSEMPSNGKEVAVNEPSGEAGVRFGDIKQTETGEESMARIQVIPKNRRGGAGAVSNTPRGVGSQFTSYDSSSPAVANPPAGANESSGNIGDNEPEPNRWEEKIQRIDTRSAELDVALRQKDVLELFMLLKSDNISEQAAAVRELDERGLSDVEIALATNLVRGDSSARVKLLSDLPRMELADPSRWYIWMAQNEDREVRRVAILGLGSVADPGIASMIRELRVHETDRELKDLLQTILKSVER